MRIVIIGLGNPILTDDSVGIKVARQLHTYFSDKELVEVKEIYTGGIRLLDVLIGYDRAIIIDAILTKDNIPGKIHHLTPEDINATWNMISVHDMDLKTALALGAMLELPLPDQIEIWGIEGADLESFGESLTEEVEKAVSKVVNAIIKETEDWLECIQSIGK
jgi:hydrogenase maturation protease